MNNVSFGAILYNTGSNLTDFQKKAIAKANFEFAETYPGNRKMTRKYGLKFKKDYTAVDLLEERRGCDVVITAKKDGGVEFKLAKDIPEIGDSFTPVYGHTVNNVKPLELTVNERKDKSNIGIVRNQIENFVEKCKDYAFDPRSDYDNERIANAIRYQQRKGLSKVALDYLHNISEDLRIDKEIAERIF